MWPEWKAEKTDGYKIIPKPMNFAWIDFLYMLLLTVFCRLFIYV